MSDHLIAEANRHAMALPKTNPTHADIAWYVREVGELRAEVERLKRDYDYDHKCLHEVRERCELWKQRAERAETELATERARLDYVMRVCYATNREAIEAAMKEEIK